MKRWMLVFLFLVALLGTSDALAGTAYTTDETPEVTVPEEESQPATEVRGVVEEADTPDALPFTGGDILSIVVVGAGALALGGALLARSRRARVTTTDA